MTGSRQMPLAAIHPIGRASSPFEMLAIAIAVGSMGTLCFSVTAPLLPDLADAFGVSRGSIGIVQAAVSVPGVLFSGFIGYLADRFGRRRVILVSLLLFTVFGMAGFVTRTFGGLVAVRFVQGIGTSGLLGVGIVLVGDQFTGPARTRAMGINLTGVTFASMLGPTVSGLLATGGVFRPFLVFAVGFPLALWATRMPVDAPEEVPEPPLRHVAAAVRTMRSENTLRNFGGILVGTFAAVIILHGLGLTTTPLYLESEFGTSVAVRGVIVAAFQVGVILTAIRIASIRDRLGVRTTITAAFVLMAAGTAAAALAPSAWLVAAGLAIAGAGNGLYIPLAQEYSARVGGALYRGVTVLTWVTVVRISQVAGPPGGSYLADSVGPRMTFWAASLGTVVLAFAWRPLQRLSDRGGSSRRGHREAGDGVNTIAGEHRRGGDA